ncbi:hypothetical protein ACM79P_17580 [Pseudomonas aeruginosa]|nr:hypothetical protein [Pseudomonas aeruginosa]
MFLTNPSLELLGGALRGAFGDQQWVAVEQDILWPWFYLQIVRDDGDDALRSMLLLSSMQEFEDFLKTLNDRLWIEQAHVVTPHFMNGTGRWLMEPLVEINVVVDRGGEEIGHCFEVEGGRCYTTASAAKPERCSKTTSVFSAAYHLQT